MMNYILFGLLEEARLAKGRRSAQEAVVKAHDIKLRQTMTIEPELLEPDLPRPKAIRRPSKIKPRSR